MLRLAPRNEIFFDLLEQEVDNLHRGAKAFVALIANYVDVEDKFMQIQDIEHKGDAITREILEKLHKTFITPIEREDISALAFTLDEILDIITGVADRCVLYRIDRPTPEMIALSEAILGATGELCGLIRTLRHLNYDTVVSLCREVKRWEADADQISRRAVARLLNDEHANPITVIKWKEIYEKMEDGVDLCEDVSNLVEGVVLKNA